MERFTVDKHVLDLSNRSLSSLRSPSLDHCKSACFHLNLAHNLLQDLSFLEGFHALTTLIADYNALDSIRSLPPLDDLDTLSLNCNEIRDLSATLVTIQTKCPAIQHLSLIRNPICPMFQPNSDEATLLGYRVAVVKSLPMLKMLDGLTVSQEERTQAMAERAHRSTEPNIPVTVTRADEEEGEVHRSSTKVKVAREPKRAPGKGQSEGNRFITNGDL